MTLNGQTGHVMTARSVWAELSGTATRGSYDRQMLGGSTDARWQH